MKCAICKTGKTRPGRVTVTLQRGETTVLIKDTPADVCQNCGEYYLDAAVTRKVYGQAEEAVRRRAEVAILRYAACGIGWEEDVPVLEMTLTTPD
jgi:YgiT-type zinc finger domain-containing protein